MARSSSKPDQWQFLQNYLIHLGKKDLWILLAWLILYFCTQWVAQGVASLLSLPIGVIVGGVIGWWLAEDAVEKAGFTGIVLWILLVLAAWLPICLVEFVLGHMTGWDMGLGRWMLFAAALIMSMVGAVWRASADDYASQFKRIVQSLAGPLAGPRFVKVDVQ